MTAPMPTPPVPLAFKGAPGSPYTRKMQALLRYRRIPYRLLWGDAAKQPGLPEAAVPLLPTFYLPNEAGELQAVTDSTPLIRRFEREYIGRSVRPSHPMLAWIDSLMEDMADEWLTKAMFHFRWHHEADATKAGDVLPTQALGVTVREMQRLSAKSHFSQRQIGRLAVVGSNPLTAAGIENSFVRCLDLLDAHFQVAPFLLGSRPASCDFALYGQLTQLVQFDPTPMALSLARSKRVVAWVGLMDDWSGLEPSESDWFNPHSLPDSLLALLRETCATHVPLLLANARALRAGEGVVRVALNGVPWELQAVRYQGKCLAWLREEHAALAPEEQTVTLNLLQRCGGDALLLASL